MIARCRVGPCVLWQCRLVTAQQPTIIATSIGFRSMHLGEWDWHAGPVYRYAADLAHAGPAPKMCIIATALGDHPGYLTAMYAASGRAGFRVSHLALYPQPTRPTSATSCWART